MFDADNSQHRIPSYSTEIKRLIGNHAAFLGYEEIQSMRHVAHPHHRLDGGKLQRFMNDLLTKLLDQSTLLHQRKSQRIDGNAEGRHLLGQNPRKLLYSRF